MDLTTTERTTSGDGPAFDIEPMVETPRRSPAPTPETGTDAFWSALAAIWRRKWWIAALTVVCAGLAVALALWLPNRYTAEARVMLPGSSGSSMSSLVESVAPGASALLGAGGGDYTRYLAILTSRTVAERTVERFDLVRVYETGTDAAPEAAAIAELNKRTGFNVSLEYNYMGVSVTDENPRRAAAIANFLVDELNRENTTLSSETASENRQFIERRMREAESALDSVQAQLQTFQEQYGITEPTLQGEALISSISTASSAVAQAEIYYASLVSQYGSEGNTEVDAARAALEAARAQLSRLTSGNNELMPVPLSRLPQVGRQYAQLQQELLIQQQIIGFVRPLYEQASFDERRQVSAVQVIDEAVPPAKKSEPRRSKIVLGVTFSALVLACAFVAALDLLRYSAPRVAARMHRASPSA